MYPKENSQIKGPENGMANNKVSCHERHNDRSIVVVSCRWKNYGLVMTNVVVQDFRGLLIKLWRTLSTFSFKVLGRPDDFLLYKQPVSLKV